MGLSLGWVAPPAEAANSCSLSGTYTVDGLGEAGGSVEAVGTLTFPGVLDLVGAISLEGGGGTTANAFHLGTAFAAPLVFSMTGTRTPMLVGPQDLTCPPDAVQSGNVCIDKYEASVWETTDAGLFAVDGSNDPSNAISLIGFRCAC